MNEFFSISPRIFVRLAPRKRSSLPGLPPFKKQIKGHEKLEAKEALNLEFLCEKVDENGVKGKSIKYLFRNFALVLDEYVDK